MRDNRISIFKNLFSGKPFLQPKKQEQKRSLELVIFFADVAGSTMMYETLGDHVAHECIVESLDSIAKYVKRNKGVVVEIIGDEVMAYFEQPLDAVNCTCDIQKHFEFSTTSHGHKIKIRIGFYKNYVEIEKGHPYGDTVNVAARVASLARGGQTVTTTETIADLPDDKKNLCRPFSRVKIKGKSKPINAVEVVWTLDDATSIFIPTQVVDTPEPSAEVVLTFEGREIVIKEQDTPFVLGRGSSCSLVIPSETASRSHARIESRHGELVFVDHSTNGTYIITIPGDHAHEGMDIHLHRRDWTMMGDGVISLGKPISHKDPLGISFVAKS